MTHPAGFSVPLSLPRRLMADLLAHAVPASLAERRMDLFRLAAARGPASPRPGWAALFTKAWALACRYAPALRRSWMGWPWARLHQHPESVASVAVERPFGDESAVFFLTVRAPDTKPVAEIDAAIQRFRDRPLESSGAIRRQLRVSALPWAARRLAWWTGLHWSGRRRGRIFGTFGVSSCAGHGAEGLSGRTLQAATLHPGTVGPGGQATVRVAYDPRVVDAPTVARALDAMERILSNDLVAELRYLEAVRAA
ncbi:MAG: hypothetical protein K2W96_16210 [Gemmataceae bacterium]|nr:hypothetical protein [Gemmataceae bacterium]